MRADEARRIYFEKYVEFEHLCRRLASKKILNYKTKGKSLDDVIMAIGANGILLSNEDGINSNLLKKHKKVRNWLSHRPKNSIFDGKNLINAKEIDSVIEKIKTVIKK